MNDLAAIHHASGPMLPALIDRAGERAAWHFLEFFTVNIRNRNTRALAKITMRRKNVGGSGES
jgi:hypothetical protein